MQLLVGFLIAVLISLLAWKTHSLSPNGALAATILGTIVFGLGGIPWAVLLLGFFISSSLLSQLFGRRKKQKLSGQFSKGSQRDAMQVLANGGFCGVFVLLHTIFPQAVWPWLGFAGTLAAVNADTWATELGVLSKQTPRLITTLQPVERGTAGAVTLAGVLASLGGAFLIAVLAVLLEPLQSMGLTFSTALLTVFVISLCGLAGSLLDSLLSATTQAVYVCPACQIETEQHPLHTCGAATSLKRGWPWMSNDWVNSACALGGGLLALLFGIFYFSPILTSGGIQMVEMNFHSSVVPAQQPIPIRYTCDGENLSPELMWQNIPPAAKSLAIIMDDPDAPGGVFVHWVLYNIPPNLTQLPEGMAKEDELPDIGTQGRNDFRKTGYDGPCPPRGKLHHYFFKLYALDEDLALPAGLKARSLEAAMQGHILAENSFFATYTRR